MLQFKSTRKQAVIEHPGNTVVKPGELKVTVEKPSRSDQEKFGLALAEFDRFEAVMDPVTGKPFRDATGAAIPLKLPVRYPLDVSIGYLSQFVKNIEGFGDGNEPVRYTHENSLAMIRELMEETYDLKVKREMPQRDVAGDLTGDMKEEEVVLPFMQYVLEKLNDKETFADPLAIRSSDSSSGI